MLKFKFLEETKRNFLEYEESKWRMKSGFIWLEEEVDNTQLFLNYAKNKKYIHIIWKWKRNVEAK